MYPQQMTVAQVCAKGITPFPWLYGQLANDLDEIEITARTSHCKVGTLLAKLYQYNLLQPVVEDLSLKLIPKLDDQKNEQAYRSERMHPVAHKELVALSEKIVFQAELFRQLHSETLTPKEVKSLDAISRIHVLYAQNKLRPEHLCRMIPQT